MTKQNQRVFFAGVVFLLVLWVGGRFLLPLGLPFLVGFLLALAADPGVDFLQKRASISRGLASFLGVTITLVLLLAVTGLLLRILFKEMGYLAGILPDLEQSARQGLTALEDWMLSLAMVSPEGVRPLLTRSVLGLFDSGNDLYKRAIAQLPTVATGILSHVTDSFLSLGTGLLSAYLFSGRMPRIRAWLRQREGQRWYSRYLPALKHLKTSMLGWLRAQLKLAALTYGLVCVGLLLLGIPFAPIWAFLIALVDAVPMLGTGLILVPWALICFLQGKSVQAMGMLGIFAAATLTRSALEPRLLGRQLGLDPLVTLAALYLGYQLFGIPGMLLSPILAVAVAQLIRPTPGKKDIQK